MKKKEVVTLVIILSVVVIVFGGLYAVSRLSKRIAKNPAGTVGNTASNLINGGYFCEDNGVVYFANSYDSNTLYSMNVDETNVKKLNSASVQYINAGGKYLYYYMADSATATGLGFVRRVMGVNRCKKDGKSAVSLDRSPSGVVLLVDNALYYQHYDNDKGMRLYKISTDGQDTEVISEAIVDPSCCYNGQIYYNDTVNSLFLYTLDTQTDESTLFLNYDMWFPIREGNYVYFLDVHNNYRLCRYNIEQDALEILTNDRVDCYNLAGDYIFYQKNDKTEPALKKIAKDGSTEEIIKEGNYTHLCSTSQYLYFQEFGDEYNTYHIRINGGEVEDFEAGFYGLATK